MAREIWPDKKDIHSMLTSIRRRPQMWLGKDCSITSLSNFLHGILWAEGLHNIPYEESFLRSWLEEFEKWVSEKKNHQSLSLNSFGLVHRLHSDNAMVMWFRWYDEYHAPSRTVGTGRV